jgi:hypothetical protein
MAVGRVSSPKKTAAALVPLPRAASVLGAVCASVHCTVQCRCRSVQVLQCRCCSADARQVQMQQYRCRSADAAAVQSAGVAVQAGASPRSGRGRLNGG